MSVTAQISPETPCGLRRQRRESWLESVEVEFVDEQGVQREPLSGCWQVGFERVRPVRQFPTYRGQRNWPGLWWFSRTGEHVGYESWVERDWLMAWDAELGVVS